jgi:hypothetical protein
MLLVLGRKQSQLTENTWCTDDRYLGGQKATLSSARRMIGIWMESWAATTQTACKKLQWSWSWLTGSSKLLWFRAKSDGLFGCFDPFLGTWVETPSSNVVQPCAASSWTSTTWQQERRCHVMSVPTQTVKINSDYSHGSPISLQISFDPHIQLLCLIFGRRALLDKSVSSVPRSAQTRILHPEHFVLHCAHIICNLNA